MPPFVQTLLVTTVIATLALPAAAAESGAGKPAPADTARSGRLLFDFAAPTAKDGWLTFSDAIMGGVSKGSHRITDDGRLSFTGVISLLNSGGFVSLRSLAAPLALTPGCRIAIRARGDGRDYQFSLWSKGPQTDFVTAHAEGAMDMGDFLNYRVPLPTVKDAWTERTFALEDFTANIMGRPMPQAVIDPATIVSVGVNAGDKKEGPFALEIAWIKVVAATAATTVGKPPAQP